MIRSVMLSAMVLLLSSLGMLAGRGITTGVEDSAASTAPAGNSQSSPDKNLTLPPTSEANTVEGAPRSITAVSVSQSTSLTGDANMTAMGDSATATAFDGNAISDAADETDETAASDVFDTAATGGQGVTREAAVDLIRNEFPTASEDVIAGWAESFEGLSAVEIMGILQQKKLLSPSLDSALPSSLASPLLDTAIEPARHVTSAALEENTIAELPGYRRPRNILLHSTGDKPNSTLSVTDFTPGQMIVTGFRSHAAIDDRSGLVMFRLENQAATRCGAFEVLSNRRIGVKLPSGEHPLAGLSPLPDDAEEFSLDESGTAVARSKTGEFHPLGTIECIRLFDTRAVRTADQVAFDFSALTASDFEAVVSPPLMRGQLELSNNKN